MKKVTLQICSVIGLVILMAVVSAQAQTQYRAHIPFDFTIGQKSYEAGDYIIDLLNSSTTPKTIVIRDRKRRNSYMIKGTLGEDYSKVKTAKLVFNRYGMQHFLAEISTPSFFIAELSKSKAQENLLARNQKVQPEIVALTKKN